MPEPNLIMTSDVLQISGTGFTLNYHLYKGGPKYLLAFHGFGQNSKAYLPLVEQLSNEYTILSFDLFFHGNSHWNINEFLSKNKWASIINDVLIKHEINNFSMAGFSLGGKFALATIESFPNRIDEVFLMAPDGIETSTWYSLATYPFLFRQYFRSMIVKPRRFFRIVNTLKSFQLMDKGILKFAASQMNTIKKRRRVYYSWLIFMELNFDLNQMAKLINENNIKITMLLGEFDKIITEKGMIKLLQHLDKYDLHILPCGHNHLIEYAAKFLKQNH
jgi:pimeloyl-ACP methyl ester carboxylesterase